MCCELLLAVSAHIQLVSGIHAFFISNTSKSNARLKLAKKPQANANQHPKAELLLVEDYSHSSSMLSSKNDGTYSIK